MKTNFSPNIKPTPFVKDLMDPKGRILSHLTVVKSGCREKSATDVKYHSVSRFKFYDLTQKVVFSPFHPKFRFLFGS